LFSCISLSLFGTSKLQLFFRYLVVKELVESLDFYRNNWKPFDLKEIIDSILNEKVEMDYFVTASLICNALNFEIIVFNSLFDHSYTFLPKENEILSRKSSNCLVVSQKELNLFISLIPVEKRFWEFPEVFVSPLIDVSIQTLDIQRILSITFKMLTTKQIPLSPFIAKENQIYEECEIDKKIKLPGFSHSYIVLKSKHKSKKIFFESN
jgi:hypothetical protein